MLNKLLYLKLISMRRAIKKNFNIYFKFVTYHLIFSRKTNTTKITNANVFEQK